DAVLKFPAVPDGVRPEQRGQFGLAALIGQQGVSLYQVLQFRDNSRRRHRRPSDGRLDRGVIARGRGVRHGPPLHGNMRSQYAAVPPSTLYAAPVMPAATSDASKTATAATSSTVLIRLSAVSWANWSTICSNVRPISLALSGPVATRTSVQTSPGQIALQVTPDVPVSFAIALVRPINACLQVTYAGIAGLPCLPSTEEMLMIRPDFCGSM